MKITKRPEVFEAIEWTGTNHAELIEFAGSAEFMANGTAQLQNGRISLRPGGWLLKNENEVLLGSTLQPTTRDQIETRFVRVADEPAAV